MFFQQKMLPAVNMEGKIYMKSRSEMCLAPNGNGGLFEAIKMSKEATEVLNETDVVQIIGVDNVLNKVLDPIQIGFTQS